MRSSDWSSDVCLSDLQAFDRRVRTFPRRNADLDRLRIAGAVGKVLGRVKQADPDHLPLGSQPAHFYVQRQRLCRTKQRNRQNWCEPSDVHALLPQSPRRSEAHESELQSLMRNSYAVLCLKKKTKQKK